MQYEDDAVSKKKKKAVPEKQYTGKIVPCEKIAT